MYKILKRLAGLMLCIVLILSGNAVMEACQLSVYAEDADAEEIMGTYEVGSDVLPYTEEEIYNQLFDINNKIELNIDMSKAQLKRLQEDYEKYLTLGSKSPIYRKADVSITIHNKAERTVYTYILKEVGVRMKGNTSRTNFYSWEEDEEGNITNGNIHNFIHLKLSFQETFDDETEYDLTDPEDSHVWKTDDENEEVASVEAAARKARKKRTFATLEKIDTKWNKCDDSTYIREYYTYEMYRANGLLAPHTNIASVDYSGIHMGVYTIYEPVDKIFISKYVAEEDAGGDLYKCGWAFYEDDTGNTGSGGADLTNTYSIGVEDEAKGEFYCYDLKTNKKTSENIQLTNLINRLNSENMTKEQLSNLVDMDSFLKFAAISYFTGNPDDIRNNYNNYYLYFMKSTKKAVFIPYDMDRCFGITNEWNPSGNGNTLVSPFSKKAEGTGNEQQNPLFKYTVCAGWGWYLSEYAAELQNVMDSEWLTTDKFNSVFTIAKANYENDTKPDKIMDNANNHSFTFDNSSEEVDAGSSETNISFSQFAASVKQTCKDCLEDVNQDNLQEYCIRGDMTGWSVEPAYRMTYDENTKQYTYMMESTEDISFKVNDGKDEWYGYDDMEERPAVLNIDTDEDGNIHAKKGTYTIHFDPQTKKIWITFSPQTITTAVTKLTKTYGDSFFSPSVLGAKVIKGNGQLTYSTSNEQVIQYDSTADRFVVKNAGSAYIYIYAQATTSYQQAMIEIPVTVNKAVQEITTSGSSYMEYFGTGTFLLEAKTTGSGNLTYETSDSKVLTVSSKGKVTLKGYGKANITIKAAASENYMEVSKEVTVLVKPKKEIITSLKSVSSESITVKWKKDSKAMGYQILYSTSRNFKKTTKVTVSSKNTVSKKITKLKKGKTYYVKIRAYTKIGKTTYYGAYSRAKKVVVK